MRWTLDEAKASEFFGWFHLKEVTPNGSSVRTFRPDGAKFHALVALSLTANTNGQVTTMRLVLARSFISDPLISNFARDISKSFLAFASNNDASPALTSLAEEIQFRDLQRPVLTRAAPPKLPQVPSAAYQVFAGNAQEAPVNTPHTNFAFCNQSSEDGAELTVTAASNLRSKQN